MEFHFTIRTYIWELDIKVGSLRYVKIEVSLQIFLCIICMNHHSTSEKPKIIEKEIYPWLPKLLRDLPILR